MKKILHNIVFMYNDSVGYLQGMNFMAHYLMDFYSSDLEVVQFFVYLNEHLLGVENLYRSNITPR
jgi:hypothetical protein